MNFRTLTFISFFSLLFWAGALSAGSLDFERIEQDAYGDKSQTAIRLTSFEGQTASRFLELVLPVSESEELRLSLERFDILDPNLIIKLNGVDQLSAGITNHPLLYRGTLEGNALTHVYLAVSQNGLVNGYITNESGKSYIIATDPKSVLQSNPVTIVKERLPGAEPPDYIDFCGTEIDMSAFPRDMQTAAVALTSAGVQISRMGVEADHDFVELFGDPTLAQNYIVQLVGAVSDVYIRDINTKIVLTHLAVWTDAIEPFQSDNIGSFGSYWNANHATDEVHIAHLFTGRRDLPFGGIAYLSGTCGTTGIGIDGYLNGSFAQPVRVPDNGNWDIDVVAHEMGHNFGTYHTHDGYDPTIDDCGNGVASRGTIMSYCHIYPGYQLNIDFRFHSRVQEVIETQISNGGCHPYDCNGNNIDDVLDISGGFSDDLNSNGIPDECEDCNGNGILDPIDIAGASDDINNNGIPDECEADCNGNGVPDEHETDPQLSLDENGNNIPDECEPDCNNNGIIDAVEVSNDMSLDLDRNLIPDECQDCNGNAIPDWIDLGRPNNIYLSQLTNSVREYHGNSGVPITEFDGASLIDTPYDIAIGPDRNIYVASFGNSSIVSINPHTGAQTLFISSGTGGLNGPTSLHFRDGILYVVSSLSDDVLTYDATTGASLGSAFSGCASMPVAPQTIIFSKTGKLLVSLGDNSVREYEVGGLKYRLPLRHRHWHLLLLHSKEGRRR